MSSDTEYFLCIYMISYSCRVVFIHATRYRLAYHVPHTQQVESSKGRNGEAWLRRHYSIHGSLNELNHSDADAQVVTCHHYLAVFHPFVE